MTDTRLLLPLQIGHESEMLDTLTPSGQAQFRWTVFVRSAVSLQFTDRSVINKVIFELHPDFANPKRAVKEPPFEVTETGYAGFVIPIQISFTGVSKTYKLMYDMNLVLEKQSKHCVEQLLLIKQPSNEFYELVMKYGARVKKKKKDKHLSGREYEEDVDQLQKDDLLTEKQSKKKKKTYLDDVRAETSTSVLAASDHKVAVPTTSTVASKNFTARKSQKMLNEDSEKVEKPKTSYNSSRVTPPSDRSRGLTNGRISPVERLKNCSVARESPMKDRPKSAMNERSTPLNERAKSSNKSSPPLERPKSAPKEKLTPPNERPKGSANEKLSSPSNSSKNSNDDQSPPVKKRKKELSVDTLLSVQKSLMDIDDAERMFAIVDAIFSSTEWPVPSLQYSEDTKILSFDLFALDPALILKLEELCRR